MKFSLAISPCPNDTFIFEPWLSGRIDAEGLEPDVRFADIAELNALARTAAVDVVKLSFFTYHLVRSQYALLEAGAALGRGCGPLLVSRAPMTLEDLPQAVIAIPGRDTTAHLLLEVFAPAARQRRPYVFHEIMPAIARGEVEAGVIIHESRFTYPQYGLHLVQDLGAHWEALTGLPIPLGGIAAQHRLGPEVIARLNRVMHRSVAYALAHPEHPMPFVRAHAQELDEAVMRAHIHLYVNAYTRELGPEGHAAIARLSAEAERLVALSS